LEESKGAFLFSTHERNSMHCFCDAPSLHQFLSVCPSTELQQLIQDQLKALVDFDDVPLAELVTFLILEVGDSESTLEVPLGRNLEAFAIETCLSHSEWFELVIIVSDDGFGYVIFIPKDIADQSLLDFCISQSTRIVEDRT
jgi:hypothetical protein